MGIKINVEYYLQLLIINHCILWETKGYEYFGEYKGSSVFERSYLRRDSGLVGLMNHDDIVFGSVLCIFTILSKSLFHLIKQGCLMWI